MRTFGLLCTSLLPLFAVAACANDVASDSSDATSSHEALLGGLCLQLSGAPMINAAHTVVASGSSWAPGTPEVGDPQEIEVDVTVPSQPQSAFPIRVAIPGKNIDTMIGPGTAYPITPGAMMTLYVPLLIDTDPTRYIPLDGLVPVTVSADPNGVSGLPGPSCTRNASYTPTEPSTALELYETQLRTASIQLVAGITPPASGAVGTLYMGHPLATNHQQIWETNVNSWSVLGPSTGRVRGPILGSGSFSLATVGARPPFYVQDISPYLHGAASIHAEIEVTATLSRTRVSKSTLDQVTWAQIAADVASDAELPLFLQADAVNNPSDPAITSFVNGVLGSNYKATLSPNEAARKLFVAVANALTYQAGTAQKPTPNTAVLALQAGWGDCGDYGMLLTTVLRAVGIPARIVYGQWPTGGGTHVITELWMTGPGWIPADATSSSVKFPKSGYPYFFGNDPYLDIWISFGNGNDYEGGGLKETWVEGPGFDNTNVPVVPGTWTVTQTNDPAQ
jgi:transglutaminase-like putative cysteine protease